LAKNKQDHTNWYTINYVEFLALFNKDIDYINKIGFTQNEQIDLPKMGTPITQNEQIYNTETNTEINISKDIKKETKVSVSKFSINEELQKEIYLPLNENIKNKFINWFTKKTGKKTIESFKLSINQILQATEDQANWLLDTALEKQITGNGWQGIKLEYLPYNLKNQKKAIEEPKLIKIGVGSNFKYDWEVQEVLDCYNEKKIDLNYLQNYLRVNYTELEKPNQELQNLNKLI
jgi:hypothetical protein